MTNTLSATPLQSIDKEHLDALRGWPESITLEFKRTLAGRDGRPDPWLTGGEYDRSSRDKLFREVVALANAEGGTLVLGVDESDQVPSIAQGVTPVPRCEDLAERLERAASQAIDPPIAMLGIRGVPTAADGSGVVIFRVPASPIAPHRAPDKECYIRRGANSVPMTMREIQEMVLHSSRRLGWVDERFEGASAEFSKWLRLASGEETMGFRITAVPLTARFSIDRVYGRDDLVVCDYGYLAMINSVQVELIAVHQPTSPRPLIRGARRSSEYREAGTYIDVFCDGCVSLGLRTKRETEQRDGMYPGWILAHAANVMHTADKLRAAAGAPECEYAIEVEISIVSKTGERHLPVLSFATWYHPLGTIETPAIFPRLPFGSVDSIDTVLSSMFTDLADGAGARFNKPQSVQLRK